MITFIRVITLKYYHLIGRRKLDLCICPLTYQTQESRKTFELSSAPGVPEPRELF